MEYFVSLKKPQTNHPVKTVSTSILGVGEMVIIYLMHIILLPFSLAPTSCEGDNIEIVSQRMHVAF